MITYRLETLPSVWEEKPLDWHFWLPEGEPRGIVQLVHGMAEHMKRYDATARALAEQGWLVTGHTHLGHGPQAGRLGYFGPEAGWENLLGDIHAIRLRIQAECPTLPYVILGHSMGSFLTRCYLTRHGQGLSGAVLSGTGYFAPALTHGGLALTALHKLLGLGKRPAPLINRVAMPQGVDWLSRDAAVREAYQQDPLCGFCFTACGFRDLFTGLHELNNLDRLKNIPQGLPLYLFSGDADPVGQMGQGVQTVAEQYRQAGLNNITLRLYPGGRHEMLNETNRQEVWQDLIQWLEGLA